jgi:hypothetical protein
VSCKGEEMPAQTDKFNLYVLTVRELDDSVLQMFVQNMQVYQ